MNGRATDRGSRAAVSWPRRVLWHSVVPWAPSAYGGQTRLVIRELRDHGVDVHVTAAAGLRDRTILWEGIPVHPAPSDVPGLLGRWAHQLLDPTEGDRLITLVDAWRLEHQGLKGIPTLSWSTFETEPASIRGIDALRRQGVQPVAVSEFVRDQVEAAGLGPVPVVHHGIDTATFAPLVVGDRVASRNAARRRLGVDPERFVVGTVISNGQASLNRKSVPETALAFSRFAVECPDALLWVHAATDEPAAGGLDLRRLLGACGLSESQIVITPSRSELEAFDDGAMATLFNSFDVLCQPSAGEGFCLPLVEAQACGVPVIASRFSAQPEQTGAGWLVGGQRRWLPAMQAEQFTPSIDELAVALRSAKSSADALAAPAVAFAATYEFRDIVRTAWSELLRADDWPRWSTGEEGHDDHL